MTTKRCTKCFKIKPIHDFSRDKNGLYGRRANCKQCQNAQNKDCRDRRQNQNTDQDSHCWCCGIELDTTRQQREQLRIKQQGPDAMLPTCNVCQYKSPQQRAEIRRNRQAPQPVKRDAKETAHFAELEKMRAMLDGKTHRPPPPDPNAADPNTQVR